MTALVSYSAGLPPLLLFLSGLPTSQWADRHPLLMSKLCGAASGIALLTAGIASVGIFYDDARSASVMDPLLYLDRLSAIMLLLVAFIGAVVIRYSRHYLAGDPGQGRFFKWLAWTIAAVMTLVISGHFTLFVAAWVLTSLCLHRLLLFYPERQGAQTAARKKFVFSRVGDFALIVAGVCLYQVFGTLEFRELFAAADQAIADRGLLNVAAFALVIGAVIKSAQFPFHSWLPEVMETPTPVSALMHAGIINAGGFLVIRMSHVLVQAPAALHLLAVIGTVTALFGSLVMLTQTNIKKSLAFSTVGQMGFMMLQCGLGAFSSAMLHIVAHALYKAHAFLSSGSVVDIARAAWAPSVRDNRHPGELLFAFLSALLLTVGAASLFGLTLAEESGIILLGAILQMALTYLLWNALAHHAGPAQIAKGLVIATSVSLLYFALQTGFLHLLRADTAAHMPIDSVFDSVLLTLVLAGFFTILMLQIQYPGPAAAKVWQAAYVHIYNGFYISALANRIINRYWPKPRRPKHHHSGGISL